MNNWDEWVGVKPLPGLLSIIIPLFNRDNTIADSLNSVLSLSYRPIEVVIADDGSTDQWRAIVSAWTAVAASPLLKVTVVSQLNAGSASARNLGICHSRGEYILFLDSDDVLMSAGVEQVLSSLKGQSDLDMCYGQVEVSNADLTSTGEVIGVPMCIEPDNHLLYRWHTMGVVYRKSALLAIGPWNVKLRSNNDWEYSCRSRLTDLAIGYQEVVLGKYRNHANERINVSSYSATYIDSVEAACDCVRSLLCSARSSTPKSRRALSKRYFIHAIEAGSNRDLPRRRRLMDKARAEANSPGLVFLSLFFLLVAFPPFDRLALNVWDGLMAFRLGSVSGSKTKESIA